MKKLFIMGAMALAALSMSAQDFQGKWFVGGNFGYSQDASELKKADGKFYKDNSYSIMPTIGTFIAPSVAVGAQLGYEGAETVTNNEGTKLKTNKFVIAPFARKYWALGDSGFNFFGEAKLPVSFGDTKTGKDKDSKVSEFGVAVQLNAGFDYVINEKFSFETSLNLANFGYSSSKPKGEKSSDNLDLTVNPVKELGKFNVGFKMFF